MYSLYVFLQISRWCCRVFTLITWILYSLMLYICILRHPGCAVEYSHLLKGYLTPSCILCMCIIRFPRFFALYSHWEQGYLTPSCFLFLFLRWSGSSISSKNTYINLKMLTKNSYLDIYLLTRFSLFLFFFKSKIYLSFLYFPSSYLLLFYKQCTCLLQ